MAKVTARSPYAVSTLSPWGRPDPANSRMSCCWPDCGRALSDHPDSPPLCEAHVLKVASFARQRLEFVLMPTRSRTDQQREDARVAELRRHALAEQEQVYYVRSGDHVKIGFTAMLKVRLQQLRLDEDALLAAEPGGREVERQRHIEFANERVGRREDFNPSRRLLAHIDKLREIHGEPVMTSYPKYEDWH